MVWSSSSRSTPSPEVALAWGSQSMRSTRRPRAARAAPRLMAVVVLPTPPFWLTTAMIRLGTLGRDYAAGTGGPPSHPAGQLGRVSFATVFHAPVECRELATGGGRDAAVEKRQTSVHRRPGGDVPREGG